MMTYKVITEINKKGYLELKNLPFKVGTKLKVIISKKDRRKNLQKLISNDHVWSEEDIKAVYHGREELSSLRSQLEYWNTGMME